MKVTIDLKEEVVLELLKLSDVRGRSFDATVNQLLKEKLKQVNRLKGYAPTKSTPIPVEHSEMVKLLTARVKDLRMGDTFTVKEILINEWHSIESPRSFGWVVKKILADSPLVETIKKSGCRRYRRR